MSWFEEWVKKYFGEQCSTDLYEKIVIRDIEKKEKRELVKDAKHTARNRHKLSPIEELQERNRQRREAKR